MIKLRYIPLMEMIRLTHITETFPYVKILRVEGMKEVKDFKNAFMNGVSRCITLCGLHDNKHALIPGPT